MLAMDHEGKQVAEWLNSLGITAFVLKYRLGPRYHHPAMLQDAGRAIRTVRANAEKWKLDPHKIAILGLLGRRPPRLDRRHPLRRRQARRRRPDRARQLAARPDDPGLSGHRPGDALRPQRLAAQPAGRQPAAGAGREPLERAAGDQGHAADVPGPHQRRHGRAGREQPAVRPGPPQGRRAGRAAPLRARAARPGARRRHRRLPRPGRALVQGLAQALRDLAQEPGIPRSVVGDASERRGRRRGGPILVPAGHCRTTRARP